MKKKQKITDSFYKVTGIMKKILVAILALSAFFGCAFFIEHRLILTRGINMHQYFFPHAYQGEFKESLFPARTSLLKVSAITKNNGYQKMKTSRIVICGLARNTADSLPSIIERIEKTGILFADYQVIIFENDSADQTRKKLKQWQFDNPKVHIIECAQPECKFGERPLYEYGIMGRSRIEKMARFRNEYLSYVKKYYSHFDYMMVIDMDLKGPWSIDGLAHSVGHDEWDAIAAYGMHSLIGTFGFKMVLYDGLAYVSKNGDYDDPQNFIKNYFRMNFVDTWGSKKCDPLIPVKSAFSGLAIYKIPSIMNAFYKVGSCEHVEFHKMMTEQGHGKLFIDPHLIVLSGHQGPQDTLKILTTSQK